MKLELKHLSPYLPYGISFYHFDDERAIDSICRFAGINVHEITIINSDYEYTHSIEDVKLILRPLSDLLINKSAMVEINEMCSIEYNLGRTFFDLHSPDNDPYDVMYLPYNCFSILLKYHYDIFDLIEKGIAIDINTL